jgi:hypothetical protein
MRRFPSRTGRALAGLAATSLLVPAGGAALTAHASKTHRVAIKLFTPPQGTTLKGTWHDKTLGHGTAKGTLHVPLTKLTFSRKGGTFSTTTYNCAYQKVTPPTFSGCWKVTKGTGRFKGMKGGGKLEGNFDGHATYHGTVRY